MGRRRAGLESRNLAASLLPLFSLTGGRRPCSGPPPSRATPPPKPIGRIFWTPGGITCRDSGDQQGSWTTSGKLASSVGSDISAASSTCRTGLGDTPLDRSHREKPEKQDGLEVEEGEDEDHGGKEVDGEDEDTRSLEECCTFVTAILHIGDELSSRPVRLAFVDEDSGAEMDQPLLHTNPVALRPNERGYSLLAFACGR